MVEEMLFYDMTHTWPDFIGNVCSMFPFGFAVAEIVWKQRKGLNTAKPWLSSSFEDGLWAPQSFAMRAQKTLKRWIYDAEEHLIGVEQWPWDRASIVIPMARCMHFRTTADSPEGQSLLRTAYRSWYWLKRMQEIEGIGTERDLVGYPVLKVPGEMLEPGASDDMKAAKGAYETFLREVRRDQNEGVLLPSTRDDKGNPFYEFELISSGGTRTLKIDESITRYQKDIARTVLADFIFLGGDGVGSLALGKTKVAFFAEALKSYAHHITAQINEVAIAQIWRLNGLDFDIMPMMQPGDLEKVDLEGMAAYVKTMADVGFDLSTDTELENHMRTAAELPPAPDRTEDSDFVTMPSGRIVDAPITEPLVDASGKTVERMPPPDPNAPPGGPGAKKPAPKGEAALSKQLQEAFAGRDETDWKEVLKGFRHG
jgi:hypothetical protein